MAKTSPYAEYVLDLLHPYGAITARSMFGGYGIYKDGAIVAIIVADELYFKVDKTNQAQYKAHDSETFTYISKSKQAKMSYWKVPLEIMENEDELATWLEQSYEISLRTKRKK
ncbi:TfoX/Sxy family protein [Rickettsiaceae bacterium]|nr:TfoX/Sxy family protein [Rickettsiaceae bacterium]